MYKLSKNNTLEIKNGHFGFDQITDSNEIYRSQQTNTCREEFTLKQR